MSVTDRGATGAVLVAVHDVLTGAGVAIFDHVPTYARRPYVSFGAVTERPWGGQGLIGFDIRFILDFWSEAPGRQEVMGQMQAVRTVLNNGDIDMPGFKSVLLTEELSDILRETDQRIFHGFMRLRILVQKN